MVYSDVLRVRSLCFGVQLCILVLHLALAELFLLPIEFNEVSRCSYGLCDVHVGFPIFGRWPTFTSLSTVTEPQQVSTGVLMPHHDKSGEIYTRD